MLENIFTGLRSFGVLFILGMTWLSSFGATLEEAEQLIRDGNPKAASEILSSMERENQALKNNSNFLFLSGVCAFDQGNYEESRKLMESAKSKGNVSANIYLGRLALLNYDFDEATSHYEIFHRQKKKPLEFETQLMEEAEKQLEILESAFERVEKIEIFDSIAVNRDKFISSYLLPASAGFLTDKNGAGLPSEIKADGPVFLTESKDYALFSYKDRFGNKKIGETRLLLDGQWQTSMPLDENLEIGENNAWPFLMSDGLTLYYASDAGDGLGGYDIYVATRESIDGEFRQPLNMGMPFNSPFDDFMMALDEENGIGWWATDRNRLGDKITVYVFRINDARVNYDIDEANLKDLAFITSIAETQTSKSAEDYSKIKDKILKEMSTQKKSESDFNIIMGNDAIYTSISEFKNPEARNMFSKYLELEKKLKSDRTRLEDMRKKYYGNKTEATVTDIRSLERESEKLRTEMEELLNKIIKLEKGVKR